MGGPDPAEREVSLGQGIGARGCPWLNMCRMGARSTGTQRHGKMTDAASRPLERRAVHEVTPMKQRR